jgi:hypothetical protein
MHGGYPEANFLKRLKRPKELPDMLLRCALRTHYASQLGLRLDTLVATIVDGGLALGEGAPDWI